MAWGNGVRRVGAGLLGLACAAAHAVQIVAVTPQGEVPQVRQVTVKFGADVVALGEPRQADPVSVSCQGSAPSGSGRWIDARTWAWDFADALPPGVRCQVRARGGWQPASGALEGRTEFAFATGGPAVLRSQPWAGATVEEDQHFILQLNAPVVEAELPRHVWCEVQGLAEALPAVVVGGATRDALLQARRLDKQRERVVVLHCGRPLPNDARLRLVWGKGIAARGGADVVTRVEQRLDFQVRKAFTAEFSCERERANAPCMPIRPLTLRFSAPVPRGLAGQARLQPAAGAAIAPSFDRDDRAAEVDAVVFEGPFAESSRFQVQLPRELRDASGRLLANAASFPLSVATGESPPIAKFAAAPFGVVERNADAMLPVTLRHVQRDLGPQGAGGQVRVRRLTDEADVLAWFRKVRRYHETRLPARELGLPEKDWTELVEERDERGRVRHRRVPRLVATREVSLLAGDTQAARLQLPQLSGDAPRPFEVIGIPLPEPGYHVVEIESRRLGQALLDKAAPMFVRTGALVTNLGVHFKMGRESSLVWVTTLDRGRPVAGAEVAVRDCQGQRLWQGRTDADGVAAGPALRERRDERCEGEPALFVSARKADGRGVVDLGFVFSDWVKGIEPWRFNQPFSDDPQPDLRAHTVFDRTLLRAGETVSMKHFIRRETVQGLALLDAAELPGRMNIVHEGSGEEFSQPLQWTAARSALASWAVPPSAKLGSYRVELERVDAKGDGRRSWRSGEFRVEEFRVPLVDARLMPPRSVPPAPAQVVLQAQFNHFAGGGMAQAPLRGSALLRPREVSFAGYEGYSFAPPRDLQAAVEADDEGRRPDGSGRLVADKLALTTDREGAARFAVEKLPAIDRPSELVSEISFADPNGEIQTVSATVPLWPSALVPGIRAASWISSRGKVRFTAVALGTEGQPVKGQAIEVRGRLVRIVSTRKRLVGGFYAYDNRSDTQDLGRLCSGSTDAQGRLECEAALTAAGDVELIARVVDAAGHAAEAATGVTITRQGELWFAQDNDDRIDVLPEKRRYEPGETARLQVRMPFREATALVAVEREGVLRTRVVTLRGDDPSFEIPIDKAWAPNAYVSVLALRGRIRDVPWYSLFTWGWRSPLEWARAFWVEGREYRPPTAMVDLAKPAFKLGVAALQVGLAAHELQVTVQPDQARYTVRGTARVRVRVAQGGAPVAGASLAFAAVDEGLLALRGNDSWQLLEGLLRARPWGVQTSTAHGEIVGRRHYGRKAVPAGGGGGRGATRELFDTLLLWRGEVPLDARGEALVEVPLNDSLTTFRLVAVADAGAQRFGTGSARITVSQDLQLLPGLPPLVRERDRYTAMLTLRNTTAREMKVHATLQGVATGTAAGPGATLAPLALPPQDVVVASGGAKELQWSVDVPAGATGLAWEAAADEQGSGGARDRVKVTQRVAPAVPLSVLQATLQRLDRSVTLPVAAPADALTLDGTTGSTKRGGLVVGLQPRLSGALPGIRRFFETYPFTCLEQKVSKAVGLRDAALWSDVAGTLPTYLDRDGLALYFPPRVGDAPHGSDRLTAYLLAATHEAGFELPAAARERMLQGLAAFVDGRIERRHWAPRADLDVRKLAAVEALARHGRAEARMLGSIEIAPQRWPTAALIDWLQILRRLPGVSDRARRLDQAQQLLRARLAYAGTTLRFSTESDDFWWWLMDSPDANAGRLVLAVIDDPAWKDELPRLVTGALGRQQRGAWLTTTANLWGSLALDKFAARFESAAVAGRTQAQAGVASQALDWSRSPDGGRLTLPWPAAAATLDLSHDGAGAPWLTVQSLAAVPLAAPLQAGYTVSRSVAAVERKAPERWSRGDILRVRLDIDARQDMSWVVLSDPVPGGAAILGSGLGRDAQVAARGERREASAWPAFEERSFEAYRSYFERLPRGRHVVEYTLRLNNAGRFALPPTRVEALYAPETFGAAPNAILEVAP